MKTLIGKILAKVWLYSLGSLLFSFLGFMYAEMFRDPYSFTYDLYLWLDPSDPLWPLFGAILALLVSVSNNAGCRLSNVFNEIETGQSKTFAKCWLGLCTVVVCTLFGMLLWAVPMILLIILGSAAFLGITFKAMEA